MKQRVAKVTEPAPGRFVFEFGQKFAGWVRLKALGEAGTEITLRFAELLNPDGTVDQSNLRLAECTDRFVLAGDSKAEVFEPHFTYHGLRYVEIAGYPGAPTAHDIEGIVLHIPCPTTRPPGLASPLLQQTRPNT